MSQDLGRPGERIDYVFFPTHGFISLVSALDDGSRLEVGIVGDEGMCGAAAVLGVDVTQQYAIVQGAGPAMRMNIAAFQRHCARSAELRRLLNRYLHVQMTQLAQTAACTHYHRVEERLARWLLVTRDRAHADDFHLTHEFLACMLGVRRAGVTQAARSLHEQGLIEYTRGDITIRNAVGLGEASCGCYRQGVRMYEQTLGPHRTGTK